MPYKCYIEIPKAGIPESIKTRSEVSSYVESLMRNRCMTIRYEYSGFGKLSCFAIFESTEDILACKLMGIEIYRTNECNKYTTWEDMSSSVTAAHLWITK